MNLKNYINTIENFPKNGIKFKDISPLLADGEALYYTISEMAQLCKDVDIIVGPDARGFLFGTPVAAFLKKPFIMVRKPGKLPGKVVSYDYILEYGKNTLEIQNNLVKKGQKAVIIDDLLATGGTVEAIIKLLEHQGVEVIKVVVLMELIDLKGREKLNVPVNSLITYKNEE
ncbi:adenine phosphoribosyltransferase [Metamycoplasma cloacale]|uniref:Adenine phosphoribosyltransferase n=1 Tax=Metamycoplasma cloacale TaxID=92401 RepID=A0A2Z4LNF3_9BACT|nr:adenine phosphoribosyltransferase [Metamycoplasma cloacale]AWX42888.1 adenine phosphoribosyltransferase [Metamycoplasma cloacale]VEU79288.1 adenine phosphoribosyltransferase [Metamycoplasma cloacale]